jgi:hypothetical protein
MGAKCSKTSGIRLDSTSLWDIEFPPRYSIKN